MSLQTITINSHSKQRLWTTPHDCAVCGSKAIGINFGAPTCAPCKAFFRRNARRREVRQMPCQILNSDPSINENRTLYGANNFQSCFQLRRCTSCRLRRCFNVGMKEELVRTDEQKQRYKQLIEINRQRRQEIIKPRGKHENDFLPLPQVIVINNEFLAEKDWRLLSNIVYAYDNYCLKIFTQNRQNIFREEMKSPEQAVSLISHHTATRVNTITSFLSFLFSIPIIQSLSSTNRFYLCKHNVRSLIFLNLHEIEQACFSEPWQLNMDNTAAEYVYGKALFAESMQMKKQSASILISDPAVTRLWLLILFFSTPLICHFDRSLPIISYENRLYLNKIQDSFTLLLWNYLLHRHGYIDAVRIFSNFIRVYLRIQRFSQAIYQELRTRTDLIPMNQAFSRAVVFERDIVM